MLEELLKKLRYKQGQAIVLNAPESYKLGIEAPGMPDGKYDFVQLFVNNASEVNEWVPKAIPLLNGDAVFWVTYPKQSSKVKTDINRDSLWSLMESISSYRPVSNVAIDEKWSALRFRHKDLVKSK
ncbi:hypothetical protein [Paenibacillus sedimenti]|uniref:DUF3052 domain-containing protein n=1 Tax=Paenibacillus sedimenti TaxID=2770274 RepID=A0A926KX17_9BACL|nr:hypothetical protein [Paenibacillus sedimenti]MBD0383798.1 hypothetical protein [Paenibacillus sedimenti]